MAEVDYYPAHRHSHPHLHHRPATPPTQGDFISDYHGHRQHSHPHLHHPSSQGQVNLGPGNFVSDPYLGGGPVPGYGAPPGPGPLPGAYGFDSAAGTGVGQGAYGPGPGELGGYGAEGYSGPRYQATSEPHFASPAQTYGPDAGPSASMNAGAIGEAAGAAEVLKISPAQASHLPHLDHPQSHPPSSPPPQSEGGGGGGSAQDKIMAFAMGKLGTLGGSSSSSTDGSHPQDNIIGLAMAGAEKLFDKKHKKGGSQSSSSSDNENGAKKDAIHSAAATAKHFYKTTGKASLQSGMGVAKSFLSKK